MSRTVIIDGDVLVYKVAEAVADTFELSTEEDDDYIYRNIGWANKEDARKVTEKILNRYFIIGWELIWKKQVTRFMRNLILKLMML